MIEVDQALIEKNLIQQAAAKSLVDSLPRVSDLILRQA